MAGDRTKRQSLRDRINAPGFAAGVARAQKRLDGQDAHYTAGYAAGRAATFAEAAALVDRVAEELERHHGAAIQCEAGACREAAIGLRTLAAREKEGT